MVLDREMLVRTVNSSMRGSAAEEGRHSREEFFRCFPAESERDRDMIRGS